MGPRDSTTPVAMRPIGPDRGVSSRVFILYGLLLGVIAGVLLGGRISGVADLRLRWAPLALAGFAAQLVLFSDAIAARVGALGPPLYVASTAMVLAAVARNARIRGMSLVALGAASNLIAIVANGGYMPTTPQAMAALGREGAVVYSNSAVTSDVALAPLTDIFAMPRWMPFANVYSVGDLLIVLGIAVVVITAMRGARRPVGTRPADRDATAGDGRLPAAASALSAADAAGASTDLTAAFATRRSVLPRPDPRVPPAERRPRWTSGPLLPALSLASVTLYFLVATLQRSGA